MAIAWGDDDDGAESEGDDGDSDGASTDSDKADTNRFYHFEVAKTKDQEENVVVREGFMVRRQYDTDSPAITSFPVRHKMASPLIVDQAPPPEVNTDPRAFCPALLRGEKVQGFMTTTFLPAKIVVKPFTYEYQTAEQIRLRW